MSNVENKNNAQSVSKPEMPEDVDELSRKAEDYIGEKEKRSRVVDKSKSKHFKTSLTLVIFVIAVFACARALISESLSKDQIRADLSKLVSAADISIQKHFIEKDQLPPQIPDRTSRMFVKYEVINSRSNPPEYILRIQHKSVVLEFNSSKSEG